MDGGSMRSGFSAFARGSRLFGTDSIESMVGGPIHYHLKNEGQEMPRLNMIYFNTHSVDF